VSLDRRLGEFAERGIDVVASSGETRTRTQRLSDQWRLRQSRWATG
jgi:hypothetical protein